VLTPTERDLLFGLSLAVIVACSLIMWLRRAASVPPRIPRAVVGRRWLARAVARWLPPVAIAAGVALAYWAMRHNQPLLVVSDRGGEIRVDRLLAIDVDPAIEARAVETGGDELAVIWVVNDSSRAVWLANIQGEVRSLARTGPVVVPPGATASFQHVETIGPDAPPTSPNWLTW